MSPPASASGWIAWLRRHVQRPWFAPVAGIASGLDAIAPVMPTQTLLIGTAVLHPRRWWSHGLWFALGATLGGTALSAALATWGPEAWAAAGLATPAALAGPRLQAAVQQYGAWALFVLALVPLPARTATAACALLGVPWPQVAAALAGGRLVAFPLLAWLASRRPAWLARLPGLARWRRRLTDAVPEPPG